VENYGFQMTTFLFFSLYIFILLFDSLELANILKYVKIPGMIGYIDLEGNEIANKEEPTK
jgi:hypothetical protein